MKRTLSLLNLRHSLHQHPGIEYNPSEIEAHLPVLRLKMGGISTHFASPEAPSSNSMQRNAKQDGATTCRATMNLGQVCWRFTKGFFITISVLIPDIPTMIL